MFAINYYQQPGGREIAVTSSNVDQYIHEVLDGILGKGAQQQAKAFREGFSKVFPITDLQTFTTDELVMLFGDSEEDWSIESVFQISIHCGWLADYALSFKRSIEGGPRL